MSHRARAKVRAWFNAQITHESIAKGREAVEKILQREGKTAIKLEDLASDLGFKSAEALFEIVGKDEYSLRNIEVFLRPPEPVMQPDDFVLLKIQSGTRQIAVRRAGGGCRFITHAVVQMLPPCATRCHQWFCDARQG